MSNAISNLIEAQDKRFAEAWARMADAPAHFASVAKSPYKYESRPDVANVFSYSIANFAMRVFTLGEEERYVKQLPYAFRSPFVNGAWDDPKISITCDGEPRTLDASLEEHGEGAK